MPSEVTFSRVRSFGVFFMKALSSALNCDRAAGIEFWWGGAGGAEKPDLDLSRRDKLLGIRDAKVVSR